MRHALLRSALPALLLLLGVAGSARAQDDTGAPPAPLRIYLDCQRCDFDYIREEVPVVDYVRDPADADLHVLVTQQRTGAGGSEFSFLFMGQQALSGMADTLRFSSQQIQTEDEVREGYTRTFRLGLVRYLAQASRAGNVDVIFRDAEERAGSVPVQDDPWNLWFFRAQVGGEIEGESRTQSTSFNGSFSASRTTEQFKIDMSVRGDYQEDIFDDIRGSDTVEVVNSSREMEAEGTAVWSLGPHWSWGASGSVGSDTRQNHDLFVRVGPALEYSFYPYAESTRRQVTATYRIEAADFVYDEITVFNQTSELRPEHSLEISAEFRQPWGQLDVSLTGSHFLDDLTQHRVDLFTNLEVRLFRGFNLDIRGSVARIKDQISLRLSEVDLEDLIGGTRELGTDYEYSLDVGFSFTFGSVFNNVVNPRIEGGGDGDFDGDFRGSF